MSDVSLKDKNFSSFFNILVRNMGSKIRDAKPNLTDDQKKEVYGLFKQGSLGDNTAAAPYAIQLEAKAKWQAWEDKKGTSQEDAQAAYIELVKGLLGE